MLGSSTSLLTMGDFTVATQGLPKYNERDYRKAMVDAGFPKGDN